MKKNEHIVRYTLGEIREQIAKGEDRTDWRIVDRKTRSQSDADIGADPDGDIDEAAETWVRVPPGFDVRLIKKSA